MRRADRWSTSADGSVLILAAVSACFFLGGLAGCLLAGCVDGGGQESLGRLCGGLPAGRTGGRCRSAGPGRAGVGDSALAAAGPSAGLHGPGSAGPALLFAVRGFLLAFSIASFVRLFGGTGCLLALLVFGVGGAFSVPALFVLGVQSFMTARTLAGRVWGRARPPPSMDGPIGCAAAGAPRLCVCVCCWMASRFPRWCPAWPAPCWPDRELCEKVLDGWIINRAMPTT